MGMIYAIKLEFLAGTSLYSAIVKAIEIAKEYGVKVYFNFNGATVEVDENSDLDKKIAEYDIYQLIFSPLYRRD